MSPFAWDLPPDARIVALVHETSESERSATVVDAIATSIGRCREQTLLLSTEPGPSPLDELAGAAESEGWPAFLDGPARLTQVAVQHPGCPYVYLPAGPDAAAAARLLETGALASFLSRVRERDGTLFLVASEETRFAPGLRQLVDGCVVLGDASTGDWRDVESYGRVPFATEEDREALAPEPAAPERAVAEPAPGETSDARSPARLVLAAMLVFALSLGGWWTFANMRADDAVEPGPAPSPVAVDESGAQPDASRPDASQPDASGAGFAFDTATERPFSVLVASVGDPADAQVRVEELRAAAAGSLYFTAPTAVRNVIYHRVFAGAAENTAEASALMDVLVLVGEAEEANAWHLRPVGLAYDLGLFEDRTDAEARILDLASRGVPAYSLETSLDGRTVFRVYGGAYENEQAAIPMAEILEAAGESAMLIPRRGDEAPSTP